MAFRTCRRWAWHATPGYAACVNQKGGRFMTTRREFLAATGAVVLAGSASATVAKPKLRKAVKYSMIGEGKTPREKLELIKSLGFEGAEMDSPSDLDAVKVAKAAK